jgi:hypothetical protein
MQTLFDALIFLLRYEEPHKVLLILIGAPMQREARTRAKHPGQVTL